MNKDARPLATEPEHLHRYTITSEGASLGYFRLVEDPAGVWVTWAEVTALDAQLRTALSELEGDGSCSSDPLKSLGLRKCLELQRENIAQLETQLRTVTEERDRAVKILDPAMPESGLLDACRQVKQVAISEADNSTRLEAALAQAHAMYHDLCVLVDTVVKDMERHIGYQGNGGWTANRNLIQWVKLLRED